MRKLIFFVMAVVLVACGHRGKGINDDATALDSACLVKTDSVEMPVGAETDDENAENKGLQRLADALESIVENLDEKDMFDYRTQLNWQKRYERMLVHSFDSIFPGTELAVEAKADSMLSVVNTYLNLHSDDTTWGMIYSARMMRNVCLYRIAKASGELLKNNAAFASELSAWSALHQALDGFCLGIVNLQWWGGSGMGPVMCYTSYEICEMRLNDLKRVEQKTAKTGDTDAAMQQLGLQVEKVVDNAKKDSNGDWLEDEQRSDYFAAVKRVENGGQKLLKLVEEWISVRKDNSWATAQCLKDMAKLIESCVESNR